MNASIHDSFRLRRERIGAIYCNNNFIARGTDLTAPTISSPRTAAPI
jgi:hypothetical protein